MATSVNTEDGTQNDRLAEATGEAGTVSNRPRRLEVAIGSFEGPLDLLLHLVRASDMDILDIPVVEIARQYNAYLGAMRELDLEIASEYLVMAATLAHIKSRMMLPPDPVEVGDDEDPRAELARQLIEYEKFKHAAEELSALESTRDLVLVRPGPPPPELAGEFTIAADLGDLVRAFERVLRRLESDDLGYVLHREDVKVQDMMAHLAAALERNETFSFSELVGKCRTRLERVVLFLALLELIRMGAVVARQRAWREDIRVVRRGSESAASPENG